MMKIKLTINGLKKSILIKPNDLLIDILRQEGYLSVKRGCSEGTCGSCTIILNGRAVKSCILLAAQANGGIITTVEGIGTHEKPHPLQIAFVEEGAIQCGFCIPGMILSAKALLDKNPSPTKEEIKKAIDGNICRCTGYSGQIKAIMKAASVIRGEKE
jgi:aerobic-type carbon monoxide dehydrogenase small subunit (CoxS/CutS family)